MSAIRDPVYDKRSPFLPVQQDDWFRGSCIRLRAVQTLLRVGVAKCDSPILSFYEMVRKRDIGRVLEFCVT